MALQLALQSIKEGASINPNKLKTVLLLVLSDIQALMTDDLFGKFFRTKRVLALDIPMVAILMFFLNFKTLSTLYRPLLPYLEILSRDRSYNISTPPVLF